MTPGKTLPCLLACSLLSLLPAQAELLLYEGFQYGSTAGAMHGQTVSGTVGLTGTYSKTGSTSGLANYQTSGLGFSGFDANGGSLFVSLAPTSSTVNEGMTLSVNLDIPYEEYTGSLYQSMYVSLATNNISGGNDGFVTRVFDNTTTSSHLLTAPDSPNSGNNAHVSYNTGTGTATNNGGALVLDTTYLLISRWTNVGGAGGGNANLWIFTESAYNNWLTDGALESDLTAKATIRSTNTSGTPALFNDGGSFIVALSEGSNVGTLSISGTIDEIRIGTTLADVAPIPEPNSAGLALLALVGFGAFTRRRATSSRPGTRR
jgi:hypothetical protein